MRRGLILAAALVLVALPVAAGCSVPGTVTPASTTVAAADGLLAAKYANAWWSDLFGGGKNKAPLISSLQNTVGMDVSASLSSAQKTADLDRLTTARQTVAQLKADGVLSQADAVKVLAAIADLEKLVNKS